jgi:hypothetical protein
MEKNFNKNENSFEMKRIDDLAIERIANLISDVEDPEEAIKKVGADNYEKVLDFLKREKEEVMAEKKLEELEEKRRQELEEKRRQELEENKRDREADYYGYWKDSKTNIDDNKKPKTKNISELITEEYARITKDMNEEEAIEKIGNKGWERIMEYRKKQEKSEKE